MRPTSTAWPFAGGFVALIVYASLYPFEGWRDQGLMPWAFLTAPWPKYWTAFDVSTNVLAYVPLGFCLALGWLRHGGKKRWVWPWAIVASLLSLSLEGLQSYLPMRVASQLDWLANSVGAVLGVMLALGMQRMGWVMRWQSFQAQLRKDGRLPFLRPDAKSQVTMRYVDGKPHSIDTVVLSTQHSPDQSETQHKMKASFTEAIIEEIIKPVLPKEWLQDTKYLINPTGRFVIGGPQGDCGLTGRKIIVDTYGGACPHGGGAFSGKDPTKVDRSAAYAARYVAKNIVAAGLAKQCQIQVAYAIGVAQPMNITVYTEGTGVIADERIAQIVREVFDLRPRGIIQMLDLLRPIYSKTAAYGHFGRDEPEFSWEKTDKVQLLRDLAGLSAA